MKTTFSIAKVIFGILIILNAIVLIPKISIFAVVSFVIAGLYVIMNEYERE